MRFYLKTICSFLLLINYVQAQQFPVENISTQEGLINNSVQSIYKDSRGVLWVGTMLGLSKIQNHKIQNLTVEDGLAHSSCWAIIEDPNHNLWFGSYGGGITFYNGKNFTIFNKNNGLVNNFIRKFYIHKNKLFIGTDDGFSIIDINTKKIINYNQFNNKKNIKVMGFLEYKNENYICTYTDGFWKLNGTKLEQINKEPSIISLHKTNDSIKYYGDYKLKCISDIDFFKNKKNFRIINSGAIWDFVETKDNQTFVAIQDLSNPFGGVFKLKKNKLIDYNQYFNINSKQIWCLFYDDVNNLLYVGSSDKGLYIVDLSKEITYYNLLNEDIKSILKIDSTEIFITSNSIYFKDKEKIKKLKNNSLMRHINEFYKSNISEDYKNLYNNFKAKKNIEISIYHSEIYKNKLFISTSLGFFKISKTGKILSFSPIFINHFKMLNDNELIASRDYQSSVYYKNYNQINKYNDLFLKDVNNPRDVLSITIIKNTLFLSSYSKGLYKFENNKSHSFFANKEWNENELITSTKNNKGQLLVATQRGNVFIIKNSRKFNVIKKIDKIDIKGQTIVFLESYKEYIVIGTNLGLNLYKDGKSIFIDEKNGLKNKLFNSCFLDKDILYIATTKGYYQINLEKIIQQKQTKPRLNISKLEVNYKSVFKKDFIWNSFTKNSIQLSYDKNTIYLEFEPKDITEKSKLFYRFKVDGMKGNKWSEWSNQSYILLPFLPDGQFNIKVQTKDLNTGVFNTQKILTLLITPPFYKRLEFIIFAFFSLTILIYWYIKNRIEKISLKNEIQKRIIETKMEALQSQMNPHFTFNAMNSIQNYILKNKTEDALQYLVDFSRLIRKTLDNSIRSNISISEEIEFINSYIKLQNKRYSSPINFNVIVSDNIDISLVNIPPMIIQPFLENSFIHAFSSKIINPKLELRIELKSVYLIITIIDNGSGFDINSIKENSRGINLVRERITLHNKNNSLKIYSKLETGTKIIITLFNPTL